MGAELSNNSKNTSNLKENSRSKLDSNPFSMAVRLYRKYQPMMDEITLCQNIALVFADKLNEFDTYTLKKVANKQNSNEITLKPVFISKDTDGGKYLKLIIFLIYLISL